LSRSITIKTPGEIDAMRRAGRLAAETLLSVSPLVRVGTTTAQIDDAVHAFIVDRGAVPAPLNYMGFPRSVCTSVNEVICHGIPSERTRLALGDIINVDVTVILDGWHGDTSATFYVGRPSGDARHVVEVSRRCLELGISNVRPGGRIGDIGSAIQDFAESHGCSVVRQYVGHGIGRSFHEGPQVPHFRSAGDNTRLREGMTFTIEPMINQGSWRARVLKDGWTAVTMDRKLSAQFEHTVAVTADGCEVLTVRDRVLERSEDVVEAPRW
jgi:methionyl aminopeptidase